MIITRRPTRSGSPPDFFESILDGSEGSGSVGIGDAPLIIAAKESVGSAHFIAGFVSEAGELKHGFLMRNGDAVAADVDACELSEGFFELIFGYADRDVDGIEAEFSECRVVDQRTFALGDGIADHGKDSGVLIDAIKIVEISDFGPGELPRGHFSFAREACVGEGGTCLAAEDAAERAEFAHAKANGGDFGGTDEFKHTDVVGWRIGHGNNFDNIRIAAARVGGGYRKVQWEFRRSYGS
jgi:hypothetical protein